MLYEVVQLVNGRMFLNQKKIRSHSGVTGERGGRRILIGKRSRVNSCTKQQSSLVLEH